MDFTEDTSQDAPPADANLEVSSEPLPRPLTPKERRKKYRDTVKASPAFQQMKEQQKQRRKQAYQTQKTRQKAKAKQLKEEERNQKIQARQDKDQALGQLLMKATEIQPKLRLIYSRESSENSPQAESSK